MSLKCTFKLNRLPESELMCPGIPPVHVFSGNGKGTDDPDYATVEDVGPIPPGVYYIVDRQSGGTLGFARDLGSKLMYHIEKDKWFMLWNPATGDKTIAGKAERGHFRLHPIGSFGVSKGCVTVTNLLDFERLQKFIRSQKVTIPVPGQPFRAYGTLEVTQ